jgi:hypothetical protein
MIGKLIGSCLMQTQAAMFRFCLSFPMLCFACHAHAAKPGEGFISEGVNLFSMKFTHSDGAEQPNRFTANIGNLALTDSAAKGHGFFESLRLPSIIKPLDDSFWSTSIRWNLSAADARASLSPRLRVESKETLIELKPGSRSVWMSWRRALK